MRKFKKISFKQYFSISEFFTILFFVFIILFLIFISFKSILSEIYSKNKLLLQLLTNEIEYLRNHSIGHIKNINSIKELKEFTVYSPEDFLQIFIIDENFVVKDIFKKSQNSLIFNGFSFENLYLKDIIQKNEGFAIFCSDIIRTVEDNISFYIIKRLDKKEFIVVEVDVKKNLNFISNQLQNENTFLIIANINNFILYNTHPESFLYFVPPTFYKNFSKINGKFFIKTYLNPAFFDDIFCLFTSVNYAFAEIINNIPLVIVFIFLATLFLIIKFHLNNKYFVFPLAKTSEIISNWKINELENEIPKFFLGFSEIASLSETLVKKYIEFTNEYEQLQEAEHTIRKMRNYLKNLIDSLPSAIISIDMEGNIIEWNKKAEEFTGKTKTNVIGKKYDEAFPYLSKFKNLVKEVLSEEKIVRINKETYPENNEKIVDINIIPITQNGLSGVAFRIDDITELENLEKQIRQSQKMEIIGLLSSGIAHDFNNALSGIISTISLMKEFLNENASFKNPELVEYIDILESSSIRAKDIVQKLLTLSRKKEGEFQPINLQSCLNDVERICKSTLDKSIELKFINPFSQAIILGDQNLIVQALLNLCINAAHAMTIMRKPDEKIGGTLTLQILKADNDDKVLIDLYNKNLIENFEYWKIIVSDTGVGIDEQFKDKIFEPFFTTKQAYYGSGIGLSTVKMIISEHKGFIDFDSVKGVGTNFYIYLPILKIDKFLETSKEETKIKKGTGLILVIDDEELVRILIKTMLIKLGYNVLTAINGDEGLEIFKRNMNNIKLVILDVAMPGKSGIEIYKEIKLLKNNIKVLFVTGLRMDENLKKLVETDSNSLLNKPFTINQLSESIYNLLSKK